MKKVSFKTNINCSSCIKTVTPFLNEVDELDNWKVDTDNPDKILEATLDEGDGTAVEEAVKKAGFTIERLPT